MSHYKEKYQVLNQQLLERARELLPEWLPDGRFEGQIYVCRNIKGGLNEEKSGSLKVDLSKGGVWKDFGASDKGGSDLVSLYARKKRLSQSEAYFALSGEMPRYYKPRIKIRHEQIEPDEPIDEDIVQPPPDVLPQTMKHPAFGMPAAIYPYKNKKGELLFYVARYDISEDVKEIRAWSYSKSQKQFKIKWMNRPLPLYGLELLEGNDDKTIVLVEGEKSCDAARQLFDQKKFICMTWPRGASNVKCADWSPLFGREVIIWPDNDDAGLNACNQICEILWPHSESVTITVLPVKNWINHKGELKPDAWDAADALDEGFSQQEVMNFVIECGEIFVKNECGAVEVKSNVLSLNKDAKVINTETRELIEPLVKFGFKRNLKTGAPACQLSNYMIVLQEAEEFKGKIWLDTFHEKIFTSWIDENEKQETEKPDKPKIKPMSDVISSNIIKHLQVHYDFGSINKPTIIDAINAVGQKQCKSEPEEWLKSLKEWDRVQRVEEFFINYCHADDNVYTRAVGRNWWMSLVARIMKPGCKCDTMLVLEGAQGAFKTTLLQTIAGDWYKLLNMSMDGIEFLRSLRGALIVEIGELNSFRKSEVTAIKSIMSNGVDNYRELYERYSSNHPRQCVFVGTTNEDTYLRDPTGARRFWPLRVNGNIEIDQVKDIRDQLFAEAYHMLKQPNAKWYEMPETETALEQDLRWAETNTDDLLKKYISESPKSPDPTNCYSQTLGCTIQMIRDWLPHYSYCSHADLSNYNVRTALKRAGFTQIDPKTGKKTKDRWFSQLND